MQRASLAALPLLSLVACSPMAFPMGEGDGDGSGFGILQEADDAAHIEDEENDGGTAGGQGGEGSTGEADEVCVRLDFPDILAQDADGDGLDGTLCMSVYVDPTRATAGSGLAPNDALISLSEAIEIAASYDPPRDVLVRGNALVEESIELHSGVSLYGGYAAGFATRDLGAPTIVRGTKARTISGIGLDEDLVIQGFTVIGRTGASYGESSYAVALLDSVGAMVHFDRCTIIAGDGADGSDGADAAPGADGAAGSDGSAGGAGGVSACARGGGDGADAQQCPTSEALAGAGDSEPGVSAISDCTGDVCDDMPEHGGHGGDGVSGERGGGGIVSSIAAQLTIDGKWIAPSAASGAGGVAGGGGAGGGAASFDLDGAVCGVPHVVDGGIGGGGGAAGCGGGAGEAGGAGGSSIAFVIVDAEVELRASRIVRGIGGSGGAGGDGAKGGRGGAGGTGLAGGGPEAGTAGDGGMGGDGGTGGGGAGGCAGSSIGLLYRGSSEVALQFLEIIEGSAGEPGAGGKSGLTSGSTTLPTLVDPDAGSAGCAGALLDQLAR